MKVILNDTIDGVGEIGDVLEVKNGYARNFLFPKKLAEKATTGALKALELKKEIIEKKKEEIRLKHASLAEQLADKELTIQKKVGEEGKLFGTVTHVDIAEEIKKEFDIDIDKKMVVLPEHIKFIGSYEIPIKLGHGAEATIKIHVEKEE